MKKIIPIILILCVLFLISCNTSSNSTILPETTVTPETVIVTETVIVEKIVEVENTEKIDQLELELEQYKDLILDLDNLSSNVYYMECENTGYANWGTGFSIAYNDTFYILTAGHYVEDMQYGTGKYSNFKFKVNDEWVYPKLLHYKVTDYLPDYAIFYSDKISSGLDYDLTNTEPDYRLGIDVLIQENNNWGEQGSCGSPIIDLDGEIIGLHVGYLQDIDIILQAIDTIR